MREEEKETKRLGLISLFLGFLTANMTAYVFGYVIISGTPYDGNIFVAIGVGLLLFVFIFLFIGPWGLIIAGGVLLLWKIEKDEKRFLAFYERLIVQREEGND